MQLPKKKRKISVHGKFEDRIYLAVSQENIDEANAYVEVWLQIALKANR